MTTNINWYTITPAEVPALEDDINSIVEMITDYGAQPLDSDRFLRDLEDSHEGLDLGDSLTSPTVKAILKIARRIAKELREANV
jgi:hypothetical protein